MGTNKGQVTVRGTCAAGHVTEAKSNPGRVTWEGECSDAGCSLPVKARRVPKERPEVTAPAATPAPDDADKPKLRKVSYDAPRKRAARKPDTAAPPASGQQQQPAAESSPAEPAAVHRADEQRDGPTDGGTAGPTRRGLRGRLAARRERPRSTARFGLPWED